MTGDEARAALDPRLLDVCRQWLSMLKDNATDDDYPVTAEWLLDRFSERGNRLLRLAYEAGRMLGAEEERVKCRAWAEHRTFTVKL